MERLVILRIRRDVGLRAGLLVAFGLEVAAQRSLAAGVGARFELFGHVLQQSATERVRSNTIGRQFPLNSVGFRYVQRSQEAGGNSCLVTAEVKAMKHTLAKR